MNRLFFLCTVMALIGLLWIGCGRKEAPAPKPAPKPPPPAAGVLGIDDADVSSGKVKVKATGELFTGLLHEFWPNGKLRQESTIKDGVNHGPMKTFFEDGRVKSTGQGVNGQRDGRWEELSDNGYARTITVYDAGKVVSETMEETQAYKDAVAAGLAKRAEVDATVWKPEVESQERESTFVRLWDDLRAAKHDWKPLEQFLFNNLKLGELGDVSEMEYGIKVREMGAPGRTLSRDEYLALIKGWRDGQLQLIETEWHQAKYEPGTEDRQPASVFKAVGHLLHEPSQTRHIVRGAIRVEWTDKKARGLFLPGDITVEQLTVLTRQGETPFVTERVINVLADNPDVKPMEQSDTINLWGRVYPPTLIVQDLNNDQLPELITGGGNLIYWNRGDFKLEPEVLVQGNNGLNHALVFADFTGDGKLDFLTLNPKRQPEVVPGDGNGKFDTSRGVPSQLPAPMNNISCLAVGDVDGDGDLDVFAAQYKPAYKAGTMPTPYWDANDGHPSYLLINDGTGRFTDGTAAAGVAPKRKRRTYSASLVDLDNDQDLDLMVVSDFAGLDLYYNDGKGKFEDRTAQLGDHRFSFGMAHSVADFDGDGVLDIYMVGMGSTTARRLEGMKLERVGFENVRDARMKMGYGNRLLLGDGKGGYQQAPYNDVVARSGWSWGCTPWDFDLDGDRDLFVANGHLSGKSCRDYCSKYWTHETHIKNAFEADPLLDGILRKSIEPLMNGEISWNGFEHNVLFMNQGNGRYTNVSYLMGVAHESDCRSVVGADMNNDGKPDLMVVEGRRRDNDQEREGYIQLIRNRHETGNHWIGAHLTGQPVGAVVSVVQGEKRQLLPMITGDSFDSQHPYTAHFGLGKATSVDALEVRWADGKITRLEKPAIDRYHVVKP